MFKRTAIGILITIATIATKPLGDAVTAVSVGVGPGQQIAAIAIAVALSSALIGFLETKRALGLNWWWHRFWYLHEVAKHLKSDLKREMAGDLIAADRLGPDLTIGGIRRRLVACLSEALERRKPVARVLVFGRPGSGKSIAMMQLARSLAVRGRWRLGIGRAMPVLIRMGGVRKDPLLTYAATVMTTQTHGRSGGVLAQGLDDLVRKGRIILILDALDETARDARDGIVKDVRALASPAYARTPLVITARTFDVRTAEFPGLELSPHDVEDLDDAAVDEFILRFGARLAEEPLGRPVRERLERSGLLGQRGLARNPFWLRLMLESGVLENDRTEIITQAVARVLSREWDERPDARRGWKRVRERDMQLQLTRQALAWLAFQMWLSGSRDLEFEYAATAVTDALAKRTGVTDLSYEDVLALARDAQIVDYKVGAGGRLQFRHALLQDFFTATALSSESGLLTAELVETSTNYPERWTALIAANEMSKREQASGVVAGLLRARPDDASLWLVGGMFSSFDRLIDADNHKTVVAALSGRLAGGVTDAHCRAATELARIFPNRFSALISDLWNGGSPDVQHATADIVRSVIATLAAQQQGSYAIAELLGTTGLEASVDVIASIGSGIVPDVLALALTKSVLTQMRALQVLERLGDARTVEPLIALLERTDGVDVMFVARALGSTRDHRAILPLVAKIRSGNPIVTMPALDALADLGPIAIPTLIELLDADANDTLVSVTARTKLKETGALAVPLLRVALGSSSESVRVSVASVLEDVADATAVPELTAATRDPNLLVQSSAITALSRLGAAGVEPLVRLIETPELDNWRAMHVQEALATIGAAASIRVIAATRHPETAVRERAAQALGVMREPAAADRLRELLVGDSENRVRFESAVALGRAAGSGAERHLRAALRDRFDLVRIGAMAGLAESGNADGRRMLFDTLTEVMQRGDGEDAVWPLRHVVARRLVELQDERVVPLLRDLVRRARNHSTVPAATVEAFQSLLAVATRPDARARNSAAINSAARTPAN